METKTNQRCRPKVTSSAAGRQPLQIPLQPDSNPTDRLKSPGPQPLLLPGVQESGPRNLGSSLPLPRPQASDSPHQDKSRRRKRRGPWPGGPSPDPRLTLSVFPSRLILFPMVTWWRRSRVWSGGPWAGMVASGGRRRRWTWRPWGPPVLHLLQHPSPTLTHPWPGK